MSIIEDKVKLLPTNSGVYVMLDKFGKIIYVGKAKNLKNRVTQYFRKGVKTQKVEAMVNAVADFYYIIAPSEIDALSLENNLIKKHKPHYNILLKDDKTYPYLKINLKEKYPTAVVTRKVKSDGAKYFGPFMGGISVGGLLETINLAFGLRLCDKKLDRKKKDKPCLNYHIGKCSAPCCGLISEEEYAKKIHATLEFLSGETANCEKLLTEKMNLASEKEDYELAIKYRDLFVGLDKLKLKRVTAFGRDVNADVIAYRENGIYSVINLLIVRGGRMLGSRNFSFECGADSTSDAVSQFIMRYYNENSLVPNEIIVEEEIMSADLLAQFIKNEYNKRTEIVFPKMGIKAELAKMAGANAEEHLNTAIDRIKHKNDMTTVACQRLKEILSLKNYPKRMECYDISNISGVDKVGSMVVFDNGEPDRNSYRRFRIKTFEGADDFRSLQEVLRRRFLRLESDPEKFPKPDLMIIDGGKGQLSSVKEVFDELNITDIDLISLAEKNEEIFTLFKKEPVVLSKRDYCLKMLQRIRDEAHRFAITYHRSLRDKRSLSSVLNKVNGLGKIKIKLLLEKFKDIGAIATATVEELKSVNGIGTEIANEIIKTLTEEGLR